MSNVVRLYHIAVPLILQHGRVAIELLSKELDLFAAKDTTYTSAKIDELKLLLKNANQLPDETVLDEQGGLTQAFQDFMTNGKEHYEELSYFIRKKFKDDVHIQNLLGIDDFAEAKRTQLDFIQFYRVLSEVQPKFEAALLEAGATPALLAQTSILYAQIEQANTTQEVFKKQRLQKTAYRVDGVNALYSTLRELEELALLVHRKNFEAAKGYIVPRYSRPTAPEELAGIAIAANTQTNALPNQSISNNSIVQLYNLGDTHLRFYIANQLLDTPPDNAHKLAPGESFNVLGSQISNGTDGLLIVLNNSNMVGRYEASLVD